MSSNIELINLYNGLKNNFNMIDYCKVYDNINQYHNKSMYKKLAILLYNYCDLLSDLELVEHFQNYKNYFDFNWHSGSNKYSYLNLIIRKSYVECMKYVLTSQSSDIFYRLVEYDNIREVANLICETNIKTFQNIYYINCTTLIDLCILINYRFNSIYQFDDLDTFKYFMNQIDYDIRTVDHDGHNIYRHHVMKIDVFKYIHQTYGHLLDLNILDEYIDNIDIFYYLLDNGYDYKNYDFRRIHYYKYTIKDELINKMLNYDLSYFNIITLLKISYINYNSITTLANRLDFLEIKDFDEIIFGLDIRIGFFMFKTLYPYVRNFNLAKLNYHNLNTYSDVLVNEFGINMEEIDKLLG